MVGSLGAPTLYDILQVTPTAEAEVVEAAYRRLAQKYHPDVAADAVGAERMKRLNAAYQILRDPEQRALYDAELWRRTARVEHLDRAALLEATATPTTPSAAWPLRGLALAGLLVIALVAAAVFIL